MDRVHRVIVCTGFGAGAEAAVERGLQPGLIHHGGRDELVVS